MAKYKSIDLFAGIGGIRLGFDRAFGDEISTVFVSEWDEYAQKTYKANFYDNFEIAGDITKINEKYDLSIANEDLEIMNNPKINGKDIIRPYVAPTVITSIIVVLYFTIRYKKLGILKTLITTLLTILGTQMVYLSIYAIVRIPVNELAMPISMLILILSFIIFAEIFEKDMLKIKSNKKQKNT